MKRAVKIPEKSPSAEVSANPPVKKARELRQIPIVRASEIRPVESNFPKKETELKLKRFVPSVRFSKAVARAIGVEPEKLDALQFGWLGAAATKTEANEQFYDAFYQRDLNAMRQSQAVGANIDVGLVAIVDKGSSVFLVLGTSGADLGTLTPQMFNELTDIIVELTE